MVNRDLPTIAYPVLQLLLLSRLGQVIYLRSDVLGVAPPTFLTKASTHERHSDKTRSQNTSFGLQLKLVKDVTRIIYVSAIALQLAREWQQPAQKIAIQLSDDWSAIESNRENPDSKHFLYSLLCDFTVSATEQGWLYFEFTEVGLSKWLQILSATVPPLGLALGAQSHLPLPESTASVLFTGQYVHARCCALLRLAHRQGLLNLADPDRTTPPPVWSLVTPNPIPWLNRRQELTLQHPAELQLIRQIVITLDALSSGRADAVQGQTQGESLLWQQLRALSQAWELFYQHCRIWGEVQTTQPEIAQSRLGLVIITQSLLRLILQDGLGMDVSLEL